MEEGIRLVSRILGDDKSHLYPAILQLVMADGVFMEGQHSRFRPLSLKPILHYAFSLWFYLYYTFLFKINYFLGYIKILCIFFFLNVLACWSKISFKCALSVPTPQKKRIV